MTMLTAVPGIIAVVGRARKQKAKTSTATLGAVLGPQPPTMSLDNGARNSETQPHPAGLGSKEGSKILWRFVRGIPGPESRTLTAIALAASDARASMMT
jgi:hypothetical protein